jgi:hypothetical protein
MVKYLADLTQLCQVFDYMRGGNGGGPDPDVQFLGARI